MSLKAFHILFITVCAILAVWTAVWAVDHGRWFLALAALVGGTVLIVYRGAFLEKVQKINL
ncbi:MAG: hypothetical protein HYZ58_13240 [Acidobacteria bacterium]|nr:hypothetical protein [Acidobacteriota bacterium]